MTNSFTAHVYVWFHLRPETKYGRPCGAFQDTHAFNSVVCKSVLQNVTQNAK